MVFCLGKQNSLLLNNFIQSREVTMAKKDEKKKTDKPKDTDKKDTEKDEGGTKF